MRMRSGWITTMLPASRDCRELWQVGLQLGGLVGPSVLAAMPEEDHRRLLRFAQRQERAEVGVGKYHDPIILSRPVKDLGACRGAMPSSRT
jgi:hypothetical protein